MSEEPRILGTKKQPIPVNPEIKYRKVYRGGHKSYPPHMRELIAEELISWMSEGGSITTFMECYNVSRRVLAYCISETKQRQADFETARQLFAHCLGDEILMIADDSSKDTMYITDRSGNDIPVINTEWVNRSRLRIDARKFLMGKYAPAIYGDRIKIDAAATGQGLEPITGMQIIQVVPGPALPPPVERQEETYDEYTEEDLTPSEDFSEDDDDLL